MTPEEIEKVAVEYADSTGVQSGYWNDIREGFLKGGIFVNEKWQEKTRWIPITEQLPPRTTETRQVFVKNANWNKTNWMIVSCYHDSYIADIEAIKASFTHWKEIEL